jgi:Ca2+-binding EF-hand superfamily protein
MFDRYDKERTGKLGRKELIQMTHEMAAEKGGISEKKAEKYVDFLLRKADKDKDGLVSKE